MTEPLIFDPDHMRFILKAYIVDYKFRHRNNLPDQIVFQKIDEYEGIKVVYEDATSVSRDAEPPEEAQGADDRPERTSEHSGTAEPVSPSVSRESKPKKPK